MNYQLDCQDIFELDKDYGRFDLILWNTPFLFLPVVNRENHLNVFGGKWGIEITLRFIKEVLPKLMAEEGRACLLTSAPILLNGVNVLEEMLKIIAPKVEFDFNIQVFQQYVMSDTDDQPGINSLHKRYNLSHFEMVLLEISHGTGVTQKSLSSQFNLVLEMFRYLRNRIK